MKLGTVTVVSLAGITNGEAYAWGCETGAFAQYADAKLVGRHTVFTGNMMMLESLCAERGLDLDVVTEDKPYSVVEIKRRPKPSKTRR